MINNRTSLASTCWPSGFLQFPYFLVHPSVLAFAFLLNPRYFFSVHLGLGFKFSRQCRVRLFILILLAHNKVSCVASASSVISKTLLNAVSVPPLQQADRSKRVTSRGRGRCLASRQCLRLLT